MRKKLFLNVLLSAFLTLGIALSSIPCALASSLTLDDVIKLMQEKKYEQAYLDATELYQGNFVNIEAKFLLALASVETKRYTEGIIHFEELQMISPSQQTAFHLASTYLMTGNLARSRKLFKALYDTNPPEDMKEAIVKRLELIDKLERSPSSAIALLGKKEGHSINGFITTGFTWDSNPNLSPSSRILDTVIGRLYLSSSIEESSDFMNYEQVGINYAYNFKDSPWVLKSGLFGHTGFYSSQKDLDHQFYSARVGLGYETNRFGFAVHGVANSLHQDYDEALNMLGVEVSGYYAFKPNMVLYGGWQFMEKKYFESYSEKAQNNRMYIGLATQFKDIHVLNFSTGYEWENATYNIDSYNRFWGTVRYEVKLPYKFTPFVYGRIQNTKYDEEDWLFGKTRSDDEYEAGLGVRKILWEKSEKGMAFDMECRYAHTDRQSNISMYDCKRNTISLQFRFLF